MEPAVRYVAAVLLVIAHDGSRVCSGVKVGRIQPRNISALATDVEDQVESGLHKCNRVVTRLLRHAFLIVGSLGPVSEQQNDEVPAEGGAAASGAHTALVAQ